MTIKCLNILTPCVWHYNENNFSETKNIIYKMNFLSNVIAKLSSCSNDHQS